MSFIQRIKKLTYLLSQELSEKITSCGAMWNVILQIPSLNIARTKKAKPVIPL
jgi:hypothetical protein